MNKVLFSMLCALVIIGCSSDEHDPGELSFGEVDFTYTLKNGVSNETITIITHASNNIISEISTIKHGETSRKIEMKVTPSNNYTIAFRTSAKKYTGNTDFDTIEVFAGGRNEASYILTKNENGKYETELVGD